MYRSSFRPQLLENRPPVRPKRIDREQCDVPVFGVQPSKRRRERQQANTYRVQGRPDDCPKRRWANTKRALHQHPPVLPAPAIRSAPFTILLAIIQGYLPSKECAGAPATFVSSNSVSVFNALTKECNLAITLREGFQVQLFSYFLEDFKGTAAVIMLIGPLVRTSKSPPSRLKRSRKSAKAGSSAEPLLLLSRMPRASSRP